MKDDRIIRRTIVYVVLSALVFGGLDMLNRLKRGLSAAVMA